ncbi:response regulator [Bauldia litoralis]|uniref:response regulator n=1 Tax=Bauldia litoralis TaxID=665467 RepID=UPI0032647962
MKRTAGGPLSGLSVLIVEDEFLIAVEAQRIVEEAGAASAWPVNSVDAARKHLANQSVDVVILDMRLGDGDSGGLMAELLACGTPFVIASGLAMTHSHAAVVVMKPYRDIDLVDAILATMASTRNS